jgi:uncharacterized protein
MSATYSIPGVYREPRPRAEGFPRVRTDVAGFVGVAGPRGVGQALAVDDWKGYIALFHGGVEDPPPGAMLHDALRSFFANGGRRAWVVNVAAAVDAVPPQVLLNRLLGLADPDVPQGLELLLRQDEVSIVVLPELDAQEAVVQPRSDEDTPGSPCFAACARLAGAGVPAHQRPEPAWELRRLFGDDDLLWAQRYLLARLQQARWRWFALLAPPPGLPAEGAVRWRERLLRHGDGHDVAALYWPWVLQQRKPGDPVRLRSPVGAVAGIFSAVDAERGAHAAPANRRVDDAVDLDAPGVDDEANRIAYDAGVNVLRAVPGLGVAVWGARTLLWSDAPGGNADVLRFVNARRCLSAIARTAEVVGRPLVFEPNTALLRIRLHQLMTDYLMRVFATGALAGEQPQDGFFVAVDTVEDSPEGQLVCRIGVALAAPAEFIVFRIGREGGVIERGEAA